MTTEPNLLPWALAYARNGLRVFPCWSVDHFGCRCNRSPCDRPGKHPILEGGFHKATTDDATIRTWWTYWPWANIGIATGDGRAVVDFDRLDDPSWPHELRALLSAKTWIARTGRAGGQGRHVWLRVPGGMVVRSGADKWPGVDVRGEGGYVIAPPSSHHSGESYAWVQDLTHDLAEMPDEIAEALAHVAKPEPAAGMTYDGPAWNTLDTVEVAKIRSAIASLDARDRDQWLRMGMALKSTGAGEQAFGLWHEWAATGGEKYKGEADCRRTWLDLREYVGEEKTVTLASLFFAAKDAGWREVVAAAEIAAAQPPSGSEDVEDLWSSDVRDPDWLIDDVIARGDMVILFGPSASGKTFVALDLCARLAHGLQVWGRDTVTAHVLYVTGEGGAGLRNRVKAWQQGHAEPAADVIGQRCRFDRVDMPDMSTEDGFLKLYTRVLQARDAGHPYSLVVVDTLSWALGGLDENKASDVGQVYTRLRRLRTDFQCANLIVHHAGKGKGGSDGMEFLRGSSAIYSNVDAVLQVSKKGPDVRVYVAKVKEAEHGQVHNLEFVPVDLGRTKKGKPIRTAYLKTPEAGREAKPKACAVSSDLVVWLRHLVAIHDAGKTTWTAREIRDERPRNLTRDQLRALLSPAIAEGWIEVATSTTKGRPSALHQLTEKALKTYRHKGSAEDFVADFVAEDDEPRHKVDGKDFVADQ